MSCSMFSWLYEYFHILLFLDVHSRRRYVLSIAFVLFLLLWFRGTNSG